LKYFSSVALWSGADSARRENEVVRDVPAAALTAYARAEDRMKVLQAGFQMHLAKPVDPAELIVAVASLAKRAGQAPE
jgi:CheY-like chemotaxis protein